MKIDEDGIKIAGVFFILAIVSYGCYYLAESYTGLWFFYIFFIVFLFSFYFFRDPERKIPQDKNSIISAADGIVVDVSQIEAEGFEGGMALRIAVFMNVFNVHVNRSPFSGNVIKTIHRPGKKLSAFNKRAEYENEHGDIDIETSFGLIRVRQIAGLIARRVVTRVKTGDNLEKGSRIGLIRFGSRVDVFLPSTCKPFTEKGDRVRAGESVIAIHG
ncbi:unnamed protein product [marine sediment metagenome]|uniref:Phosphatidylserine decarboxylase n=1 Tax=marine sediment metagenome TaxID=412755 RepID=X1NZI5_9ZZZZ